MLSCKQPVEHVKDKLVLALCIFTGPGQINRLPEFVAYHSLMGVEKFFVYYNANDKELEETQRYWKTLVEAGIIELVPFYFKTRGYVDGIQTPAYSDCFYKHKDQVKWLGILDTDEFFKLAPSTPFETLPDYLNSLEGYSRIAFHKAHFVYENGNVSNYIEKCPYPSFIND